MQLSTLVSIHIVTLIPHVVKRRGVDRSSHTRYHEIMDANPLYDAIIEQALVPCQVSPCSEHNLIRLTDGHGAARLDPKYAPKYRDWIVLNIIAPLLPAEGTCWAWLVRLDEAMIEEIKRRQQND